MNIYGIPSWFHEEHGDKDIWNPPMNNDLIKEEIGQFKLGIENGWSENDAKNFVKNRHYLFDGLYRHGHGTFVFDEQSLAGKYRIDWLIGSGHSGGIFWDLIELECPRAKPFNKDGDYSKATRKGIKQIKDWRLWLQQNIDLAQKPKSQDGLGLFDINNYSDGIVVVGQRNNYRELKGYTQYNRIRQDEYSRQNINIYSYDTLIEKMYNYINNS